MCPITFGPCSGLPANSTWDTNAFGCLRNISEECILNHWITFNSFSRYAILPALPSDLLRWTFSCSCFCLELQRQGLSRGSLRGAIQETQGLASSTSSQKDSCSWAAGKGYSSHTVIGAVKKRQRLAGWDVKHNTLAGIMGHLFTVITQIQGIIQGKEQDCLMMPAAHACCQKQGATTRNTPVRMLLPKFPTGDGESNFLA